MSYIVLARKYRPQSFSEVYAQDHVTKILQSAIESGRIAHAYLFTGPRGVGKTSLARIMAKSLNCEKGPTSHPCNECVNCREITQGISPDVIEIDGASNTGVDDIRELQRELLYAASGAKYKIYIIDEVHMLSKNAFNALLKTLEEPPENVIFIFATTEPHKVLPTIISRCQRYDFKRIPTNAIVQRLKDLSTLENIKVDDESLYLIARKADGGMRDALSLLDQTISYCNNDIQIAMVRQIFGMIPTQVYHDFMLMIKSKDSMNMVLQLHQIFEEGIDLQEFMANMLEYLRMVLLHKVGVKLNDVGQEELPLFEEIATLFSRNEILYIIGQIVKAIGDLKLSSNPYLLIEALMIRLSRMDEMLDISTLIETMRSGAPLSAATSPKPMVSSPAKPAVKSGTTQASAPASYAQSAPIPDEEPVTTQPVRALEFNEEAVKSQMELIAQRIKKKSLMASMAFKRTEVLGVAENALRLKTGTISDENALESNRESIETILKELFGRPIRVRLEGEDTKPLTKVEINRKSIEELKRENPEIAEFINQTNARLI